MISLYLKQILLVVKSEVTRRNLSSFRAIMQTYKLYFPIPIDAFQRNMNKIKYEMESEWIK